MAGEGRYQPTNFPWFVITEDQLVWDFATGSSNYKALRQAGFDGTQGKGWLIEESTPFSSYVLSESLQSTVMVQPASSGYGDDMGNGALQALNDDLDKLWGKIPSDALWVSRMYAELPRAALATDLSIGAASAQDALAGTLQVKKGVNVPECPTYPPCDGTGGGGGATGDPGVTCTVGSTSERSAAVGVLALLVGLALGLRRRSGD